MKIRLHTKYLFLLWSLFFCQVSFALSLGALSTQSSQDEPLESKIFILMSTKESKTLGAFEARLADQSLYEKFGIQKPNDEFTPSVSIQKDKAGKPIAIVLKFSKKSVELEKAFNDAVIELIWSSGKITRVYTILNTQSKEIQVQAGDSLVNIASQIAPQLSGVEFNQVLVALYRLNPKAFYAGNINRLKQGEKLIVPSETMAASIPEQEAREFATSAAKNYRERQLNKPSEDSLKNNNRTYQQAQLKEGFKDRLKIGSSQTDSEQAITQAKLNEDMIAQQKMLEEAQVRIAELERNIADLKEINAKKTTTSVLSKPIDFEQYGTIVGILALTGIFLFGILRKSSPYQVVPVSASKSTFEEPVVPTFTIPQMTPVMKANPDDEDQEDDSEVVISQAAINAVNHEVPKHVKELFSSIDLSLPSDPVKQEVTISPVVENQSVPNASAAITTTPSGYSLDLGVNANPGSSSSAVSKLLLNSDEQKVRLNLARSYIKIKDFETARILLTDLVELGDNADQEVYAQASEILVEIS
ncbi:MULTISPECIES: FimV/HubP family polar landmark protein [unclassified Polynucleobacter]|uniref:type IV pilus assembly protein FimV n=1 Tax=unclassified Polynucleobacter TaxID=2640945 RepID=UPI00248FD02B|nr:MULTISPECIES: FimV/HubP family polar landmark protein [unclassified Polynucleobacter]